jgi:ABC-type bacteriocin/lantibiotic exporter with double-glycine peptidase domain
MERFDEAFTGVCIQFAPGEGFEPSGKQRSMFSFALKRLKGTRSAVLFVVITAVIASLAGIISTGFSRVFLDKLLTGDEPGWVTPFFIGLGLLVLLQLIAAWIQAVYSFRLEGKLAVTSNVSYMW